MSKKVMSILLGLTLIAGIFAGCSTGNDAPASNADSASSEAPASGDSGSEPPASEPAANDGETIVLEFFQQKNEEGPQKGYQQVIDRFHEEYPNIRIEMNTVPDAGTVLTARVSSNDIPPIFSDYPTQMQFKQKVENGFVEKLSGQDFLSRVNQSALDMSRANDGELYALPYSNNFMGVYYNIDIFEENEIEIPQTYAELIAAFEKLKANGIAPIGLTYKDPGRVGHMFQCMTVAWTQSGVENILEVANNDYSLQNDAEFRALAEKMLEIDSYANDDAFGIADTNMWENFANGQYATIITGSYARGTITLANPNINMGVFPLPNDTNESTNVLTGVDAAVCISAHASDAEKDAGLKFLEFLSRTENAQIWCDLDGAPSCITEVVYKDDGVQPVIDMIQRGTVHDWMASTIPNNVVTDLYNVTQNFLMDRDVDAYLADLDTSIAINIAA